ncbi:hypothetical protein K5N55_003859 [Vibrio vulnificus]|nr:hypothetical protein [Vibrio vulnificus]MCU8194294.1 hypothetical protein [Vibrio vulnificus]HAS6231038.1 hypothetical protein [Vibrio vulnificus]HDY7776794.1 hypothetical protein [Vibrio vulnificus]
MAFITHITNLLLVPLGLILVMALASQYLRTLLSKLNPWLYKITIGPGTIVHELSHLGMALCFGMQINHVQLWSGSTQGHYGHVNFAYSRTSFIQLVGLFFVGLAPLFVAIAISLFITIYGLQSIPYPGMINVFEPTSLFREISRITTHFHTELMALPTLALILLVSFYLLFLPHVVPSREDLKLTFKGAIPLALVVTCILSLLNILGDWPATLTALYSGLFWFLVAVVPILAMMVVLLILLRFSVWILRLQNR